MKSMKRSGLIALFAAVILIALLSESSLADFPPQGDDLTQSLGKYKIKVMPKFRPLMVICYMDEGSWYTGYDPITHTLESPLLFDDATVIGRSGAFLCEDPTDVNGALVGTANTLIKDSDIPLWPDGFEGPAGTREVHTEIVALYMKPDAGGDKPAVRAGIHAPDRPMSPGEVESQSASGDPAEDFPADSFFDVYVEVDLPPDNPLCGILLGTIVLYNDQPMLVEADNLTGFPPVVVYKHGNSDAVPVKMKYGNPPFWSAGEVFGHLTLAGHMTDDEIDTADKAAFEALWEIWELEGEMPTAVELASCIARGYEDFVKVEWTTASEIDNAGFNVYRGLSLYEPNEQINERLIPARGSAFGQAEYSFIDRDVEPGITYYYWVEAVDLSGYSGNFAPVTAELGQGAKDGESVPPYFSLAQNHPNPFNPTTEIKYELPVDCHVRLDIYNVLGQKVATLVDEMQTKGYKTVSWNTSSSLASGIYLYRLQAGDFVQTRKMVLLR